MTFSFRLRFMRADGRSIDIDGPAWQAPGQGEVTLQLRAAEGQSIAKARNLAAIGDGFDSEDAAGTAGLRLKDCLLVACARERIGVDLGSRAAAGEYTAQLGAVGPLLNDVHGLMTFRTKPPPKFIRGEAFVTVLTSADNFGQTLNAARDASPVLSTREHLAFELFNLSIFQSRAELRLLLLVMAIEALVETLPRPPAAQRHVKRLICRTRLNVLMSSQDRDSLLGALQWLLSESIRQGGRRVVQARVGENQYDGVPAAKFFNRCYDLRSRLVHGNNYPSHEEIASVLAELEFLVSDLLTVPVLGQRPT